MNYLLVPISLSLSNLITLPEFEGLNEDWRPYLGPVINQGGCANCWAESIIQYLTGQVNKFLPLHNKEFFDKHAIDGKI